MKLLTLLLTFFCSGLYAQCGSDRWNVKTCADTTKIDTNAVFTTIPALASLKAPKWSRKLPRTKYECKIVTVQCFIIKYLKEDDGDYHLVLKDSTGKTMIAEIPSLSCVSATNKFYDKLKIARAQFDSSYKISSSKVKPGVYEITGVIYFDKIHGQAGVAKNGIEIHPVFAIKLIK